MLIVGFGLGGNSNFSDIRGHFLKLFIIYLCFDKEDMPQVQLANQFYALDYYMEFLISKFR